ncbi:GNAT family N-acetyltransferase [bacterium]|nr:GNAT family N-acetyltransferase [bacterium]
MSQLDFFKPPTKTPARSEVRLVAATLNFQIKLIEVLSARDADRIIDISRGLIKPFGADTAFSKKTVWKYFNHPHTLPFVGVLRNEIIGFLVGVPLEHFSDESWAAVDPTLGTHETIYTYAFIFDEKYQGHGYAKMLKRVYINWLKKRGYLFVSGHVREGISQRFSLHTQVLQKYPNWHDTGKVFEYYQRPLR